MADQEDSLKLVEQHNTELRLAPPNSLDATRAETLVKADIASMLAVNDEDRGYVITKMAENALNHENYAAQLKAQNLSAAVLVDEGVRQLKTDLLTDAAIARLESVNPGRSAYGAREKETMAEWRSGLNLEGSEWEHQAITVWRGGWSSNLEGTAEVRPFVVASDGKFFGSFEYSQGGGEPYVSTSMNPHSTLKDAQKYANQLCNEEIFGPLPAERGIDVDQVVREANRGMGGAGDEAMAQKAQDPLGKEEAKAFVERHVQSLVIGDPHQRQETIAAMAAAADRQVAYKEVLLSDHPAIAQEVAGHARFVVQAYDQDTGHRTLDFTNDADRAIASYIKASMQDIGPKQGRGAYVALTDAEGKLDAARTAEGSGFHRVQYGKEEGQVAIEAAWAARAIAVETVIEKVQIVDGGDRLLYTDAHDRKGWIQPLAAGEVLSEARGRDRAAAEQGEVVPPAPREIHTLEARPAQAGPAGEVSSMQVTPYALGKGGAGPMGPVQARGAQLEVAPVQKPVTRTR